MLRVAGVYTPAFVERASRPGVSSRFWPVSLGFTPQPLLSECSDRPDREQAVRVAGVYTPAFVERTRKQW